MQNVILIFLGVLLLSIAVRLITEAVGRKHVMGEHFQVAWYEIANLPLTYELAFKIYYLG